MLVYWLSSSQAVNLFIYFLGLGDVHIAFDSADHAHVTGQMPVN